MRLIPAKPLVALIALAALGPCSGIHVLGPLDELQGTWGGENAALIADDTSAHVHIG